VSQDRKRKRKRASIGIDIGGTKSLYALFDASFEVLAEEKLPTHPEKGGIGVFDRGMSKAVKALLRAAAKRGLKVKHVGAGCAGEVDMRRGIVRSAPNLTFLDGYAFRDRLEKITGAKVFVVNDVLAGVYGEHRLGAARKARHVIGVFIGTGVGGAMIVDGRLHLGATGIAGNIGNYLLHAVDAAQDSSRKQLLDNVASRIAIAGDAAALAAKHKAPILRAAVGTDVTDIKSADIAEAIRKGDKAVEELVRSRIAIVGAAISNLVDFINPDVVVLGGGLVEAMPSLIRRQVEKGIAAHSAPRAAKAVKVVVAKLHSHAGTAGAAKLAVDMFSDDPPFELP
jgi:glucokinase